MNDKKLTNEAMNIKSHRLSKREIEDNFQRDTDVAISLGVFGVPSYVISEHLFWGQDRLDFLEMSLSKKSSKHL